jgi:hypothetical protein
MDALEKSLDKVLVQNAPVKLPENAKKTLVDWLPWINLCLGVLQLWAAWTFWSLAHLTNRLVDYTNSLYEAAGASTRVPSLGLFFWVSFFILLADAVLIFLAFPGLRAKSKARGWNLLFFALILDAAYGVFRLFSDVGGGFSAFFWSVLSTVVGAYFLFQIRSYYNGKKSTAGKQ